MNPLPQTVRLPCRPAPDRARCSRRAALAALAACVLALAGCGASLVYGRLDTLVGFYLEGLVTLDRGQQRQLEAILRANLDWHRRAELVRYDAELQGLARAVADGTTRAELAAVADRAETYWRDIWIQASPGYTRLALTLGDAQVEELIASLARRDEREWRDYVAQSPAERRAKREKAVRRNVERFTGTLSAAQRDLVRRYAAIDRPFKPLWYQNRRAWREALAATLRARADTPEFAGRMLQLIARPDDLWTPDYRRVIEENREDFIALLASLDATLTPGQRASVQEELLSLAEEVRNLARRPG